MKPLQALVALLFLILAVAISGCCCGKKAAEYAPCLNRSIISCRASASPCCDPCLQRAQELIRMAEEMKGDPGSVDLYYQATTLAWQAVARASHQGETATADAQNYYNQALEKLIVSGQRYGRLDPRRGLQIHSLDGLTIVPVEHRGFIRPAIDFDCLKPKMHYRSKDLNHVYRCYGLGVANAVVHHRRPDEKFRREKQEFAATAVLVPAERATSPASGHFVLRLLDPLRVERINVADQSFAITRDISAPIADLLENRPRNDLRSFIQPGASSADAALFVVEPHQPGKIPLVFVHGLLSDPFTWANVANEIQARNDLVQRYQIWGFEYPTGEPFLVSAAELREQLKLARNTFDPHHQDQAMSQMVLVGHSMGGLLAKLQVTCSRDLLWQSVANRPLPCIAASAFAKQRLSRAFYFQPSADIARVIYMATPHRGSPWARRPLASLGSKLVEEPADNVEEHQRLICNNPDTFSREFSRRIPTSIDLLRTDSNLLSAIDALPVQTGVIENSIIGRYRPMIGAGASDGIVPVSSAVRSDAQSELLIRAKHVKVHRSEDGIGELVRLLRQHAGIPKTPETE